MSAGARLTHDERAIGSASRFTELGAVASDFFRRLIWYAFVSAVLFVLYYGWINRNERHWTPDHGLGYWLGIAGGTTMLLLLIYPMRKRWKALRFVGATPLWFRLHMALGLLGPALILLHCNFKSDSTNATLALNSMLIVAGSGLIGRYLYTHIYSSLAGRRIEAASFFETASEEMSKSGDLQLPIMSRQALDELSALTKFAIEPQQSVIGSVLHRFRIGWDAASLKRSVMRDVRARRKQLAQIHSLSRKEMKIQIRHLDDQLSLLLEAVRRASSLAVYERLFALWHFLHLPLFLMLVATAIVHIIAVHLY